MPKKITYKAEDDARCKKKVMSLLSELPYFVTEYVYDLGGNVTPRTQMAYIYDIRRFLRWFYNGIPELKEKSMKDITVEHMGALTLNDINEYYFYLSTEDGNMNNPKTLARKSASLNSLLDFLYRTDAIASNPMKKQRVNHHSRGNAPIVRLQPNETVEYLNTIENIKDMVSGRQEKILSHTTTRDLAIVTLLLGTGIRVSECVGLDLDDLNFSELKIRVRRKGAKEQNVAMSDEVEEVLKDYLRVRSDMSPLPESEYALFLSSQRKRISTRAVENLVKKYAKIAGIQKNISPHKLRKTYGTELYNETGDIYLVARALGHRNVNTTKDHYILSDEDSLIMARNKVKLRKD